jgi:transcriptional regulator with XRE-family HTH domain
MKDLGKRLKIFMEEFNLSQAALSKKTGTAQSSLSEYLKGKVTPKAKFFSNLAENYPISLRWLIAGKGEMLIDLRKDLGDYEEQEKKIKKLKKENEELRDEILDLLHQVVELQNRLYDKE